MKEGVSFGLSEGRNPSSISHGAQDEMRVDCSFETCLINELLTTNQGSSKKTKSAATSPPNVEEAKVEEKEKTPPASKPKAREPSGLTLDDRILATAVMASQRFQEELKRTLKQLASGKF